MNTRILSMIGAALALNTAMPAAAQDDDSMSSVVVTATRTAQTADQNLASVTVIDRKQIDQSQADSLEELLVGHSGIDFSRNGGLGKQSSLYLRGTNSNHTLILVDGLKIGSATSGTAALHLLPLDQIERIEIVRGPRSSLYGSEAIGGVIQIFTRKGSDGLRATASAGVGSNGLRRGGGSVGGAVGNFHYSVGLSALKTDGFDARRPTSGFFAVDEPDEDGYSNNSLSTRLGYDFGNGFEVEGRLMSAQGESEFDGTPDSTDFVQRATGLDLAYSNSIWHSRLTLGQTLDESENLSQGVFSSQFDTERNTLSWQNDISLSDNYILTLGADKQDDEITSSTAYNQTSRTNKGMFVQFQGYEEHHDFQLSLRSDDEDNFDRNTTGNFAMGIDVNSAMRMTAGFGTAFKAPSFNDLYWPADMWFVSNPNLKPETSKSVEVGMSVKQSWGNWRTNLFQTEIDDLIVYDASVFPGTMNNLNQAEIKGLELGIGSSLMSWNIAADLTILDHKDVATGNALPRRADGSLKLDLSRSFDKLSVGMAVIGQQRRFDDVANTTELGGYGVVNLRASWEVAKQWSLDASLDNAGDKVYETVETYNTGGRTAYVGVRYDTL